MSVSQIFAHRGANREAPENTRAAFDAALVYPINGIETDIQLTRDQQLVLWHDRFLDKLGWPGRHVDDFDAAELFTFDCASHFSAPFEFQPMMLLGDFLAAYVGRVDLLLEVKNRDWETAVRQQLKIEKTLALMEQYHFQRLYLSSFHLESLVYGWQLQPACPFIYNLEPDASWDHIHACLQEHSFLTGYCLPVELLAAPLVHQLRAANKTIAVYTCNTPEQIQLALQLQVDIVISDLPNFALQLRDQHAA